MNVASDSVGDVREINRRVFIKSAAVGLAAVHHLSATAVASQRSSAPPDRGLIDTNVSLFQWPARRLPLDDEKALFGKLRSEGVVKAWAGSFEALMHLDMSGANARLAAACRKRKGFWIPFGSVNPSSVGWREDLRRCRELHGMPGIRLYPAYHGYALADRCFAEFLDQAGSQDMIVQIACHPEDTRIQHPRLRTTSLDLRPLQGLVQERPGLKLVLLNWNRATGAATLSQLTRIGRVFLDTSMFEGAGGVQKLVQQAPVSSVLFGSHSPFFYFESALLKLKESDLPARSLQAIRFNNANSLVAN
jgi:predicted TIM-barrel fold metal-dependent hydrolase